MVRPATPDPDHTGGGMQKRASATLPVEGFLMKDYKRAILFANGDFPENDSLTIEDDDFLVAVDGGLRHLLSLSLTPQLLIGDLDSVSLPDLDLCMQWGVETMRFPTEKDETDLEIALLEVLRRGFSDIVITCALGDRLDHTLANLALLAHPQLKDAHVYISNGETTVYYVSHYIELESYPGALISLLPWGEPVHGVTTTGLKYALSDSTLYPWKTVGISNVTTGDHFSVSVKSGQLFLFHITEQSSSTRKDSND